VDGGKHPTIIKLRKGAYHIRPPLPRYRDVQVVLQHMDNLGPTSTLSLKLLTFKLAMLSLTRLSRLAELAALQLDRCQYKPE